MFVTLQRASCDFAKSCRTVTVSIEVRPDYITSYEILVPAGMSAVGFKRPRLFSCEAARIIA